MVNLNPQFIDDHHVLISDKNQMEGNDIDEDNQNSQTTVGESKEEPVAGTSDKTSGYPEVEEPHVVNTAKETSPSVTGNNPVELVIPAQAAGPKVTGLPKEEEEGEVTSDDEMGAYDLNVEPVVTLFDKFFQYGTAVTDLKDLVRTVYPSSKLNWLSNIRRIQQRKAPPPASRGFPLPITRIVSDYVQVVLLKKTNERRVPGLNEETISSFFLSFFAYEDKDREEEVHKTLRELVSNTLSMILAITVQKEDRSHILVACVVFHPDNNVGSFVPYLAVHNEGTDNTIIMNEANFIFPTGRESAVWHQLDIS